MKEIDWQEFAQVELRAGTIVAIEGFFETREKLKREPMDALGGEHE
jgi:hypothetical protein